MSTLDYDAHDGLGLAALIRDGEITASEVVEEAIGRAERAQPTLSFLVHRMYESARRRARGPLGDGPFAGVPYVVKDLLAAVAGAPSRGGSTLYEGVVPDHDSELVARHRRAGLIPIAKTSTPEMGLTPVTEPRIHAPTETPWRRGHTAGGSSGGSAAAVGARVVPIGHGGDGGGSIRIPASCCGAFGLKPTRGRTPTGPDASEGWFGFAIEHAITRSVRDSAALLDATCAPEPGRLFAAPTPERPFLEETRRAPGRLRVAFTTRPHLPGETHPDCRAAVEDAARLCESLGHDVEEASPLVDGHAFARAFVVHVASAVAAETVWCEELIGRRARREDLDTETALIAMLGRTLSAVDLTLARRRLFAEARTVARLYERYDVLLTPTLSRPPARHGELSPKGVEKVAHELIAAAELQSVLKLPGLVDAMASRVFEYVSFTPIANVTGQPSMSVPLFWNHDDLPIGVMFTGRFGEEGLLFRLAAQLEAARPWAGRRPAG
ncbi:MAG: amidase [Polyangiaceae bacterium]|nr:amidase [Polyangiaceae bacterium]